MIHDAIIAGSVTGTGSAPARRRAAAHVVAEPTKDLQAVSDDLSAIYGVLEGQQTVSALTGAENECRAAATMKLREAQRALREAREHLSMVSTAQAAAEIIANRKNVR